MCFFVVIEDRTWQKGASMLTLSRLMLFHSVCDGVCNPPQLVTVIAGGSKRAPCLALERQWRTRRDIQEKPGPKNRQPAVLKRETWAPGKKALHNTCQYLVRGTWYTPNHSMATPAAFQTMTLARRRMAKLCPIHPCPSKVPWAEI